MLCLGRQGGTKKLDVWILCSIHRFLSLLSTDTRPKITREGLYIIPLTGKFWGKLPVISPYGHQVAIITYRIREGGLEEGKYFQVLKWLGLKVAD